MERTTIIRISERGQDFKEFIHETLHLIETGDAPLESHEGFEILSVGTHDIVYRKGDVVIKVGIDMEAYRDRSGQAPLREFLRPISDGENLLRCGRTASVPTLYAYTDSIVFMRHIEGTPLSDLKGEAYQDVYEKVIRLYRDHLEFQGFLSTDLRDDNILLDEKGYLWFIGHGSVHFAHATMKWGGLFIELNWTPWNDFFEKYRFSGRTE